MWHHWLHLWFTVQLLLSGVSYSLPLIRQGFVFCSVSLDFYMVIFSGYRYSFSIFTVHNVIHILQSTCMNEEWWLHKLYTLCIYIVVCSPDCLCEKRCDPDPYSGCPVKAGCDLSCQCSNTSQSIESRFNGRCVVESPVCTPTTEVTTVTVTTQTTVTTTAYHNITVTTPAPGMYRLYSIAFILVVTAFLFTTKLSV